MSQYYSKDSADRELCLRQLLIASAEYNPLGLPTPARIHHNRIQTADVISLTKVAYDFKQSWNIEEPSETSFERGLLEIRMSNQGLSPKSQETYNDRDIMVLRPSWEDPIPFGVASASNSSSLYQVNDFAKAMIDDENQLTLYMLSKNIRYGERFYPLNPNLRDQIEALDGSKLDYGVRASRDFYEEWLAEGPWEPSILFSKEDITTYYDILNLVYTILKDSDPNWISFEDEVNQILANNLISE